VWRDRGFVLLDGGVVGRSDDMLIVRGVNVFPGSVEQIVRGFAEVEEFRMIAYKREEMEQLTIEIEDRLDQPARVADELRVRLGLKVDVRCVPLGSLPRFEGKGRRLIDNRQ
jgi:phenylacetate-CoA ligase